MTKIDYIKACILLKDLCNYKDSKIKFEQSKNLFYEECKNKFNSANSVDSYEETIEYCKNYNQVEPISQFTELNCLIEDCENKIEEIKLNEKRLNKIEERRSKLFKLCKILCLPVIAIILLIVLVYNLWWIPQSEKYAYGHELVLKQKYDEALEVLDNVTFPGTKELISECNYQLGITEYNNRNYTKALSYLNKVGNYKDSKDLIKESHFCLAMDKYESGDYYAAFTAFGNHILDGYKNSEEMKRECKYLYAVDQFNKQNYSAALLYFKDNDLNDYKDVETYRKRTVSEFGNKSLKEAKVGSSVYFGSNSSFSNMLQWKCLDISENFALIIAVDATVYQPYSETTSLRTWEATSLRSYLNTKYLNNTEKYFFPNDTESRIKEITNDCCIFNTTKHKCNDKVFILGKNDVERYFPNKETRELLFDSGLRDAGGNDEEEIYGCKFVDTDGNLPDKFWKGEYSHSFNPAMWIKIS